MKTLKQTLLIWLSICGLWVAPLAMAQEANGSATDTVPTNEPAPVPMPNAPLPPIVNPAPTYQSYPGNNQLRQIVLFGQDADLKAGDTAEVVVVIGGSAKVHGNVHQAVVVIGGDADVDGDVGDSVVAIMGNVHLNPGADIHNDTVAVMGSVTLDPEVKVGGDAVSVGGKLNIAPSATVHGQRVSVGTLIPFPRIEPLRKWVRYCLFELRPLAPQVGWVWIVAGVFFLIYLFIAAVFPRPVEVCVDNLSHRPATTFLMGLLTKLFMPVVYLILAITGVGVFVVPFIAAALFFCAIFGKIAILEWIGLQSGKSFGAGFKKPLLAFVLGFILVTLLYMIPVIGLLTYLILGVWGLGCAITATFGSLRRETPKNPTPPPVSGSTPIMPVVTPPAATVPPAIIPAVAPVAGTETVPPPPVTPEAPPQQIPPSPASPAPVPLPPALDISSLPRAGFWERMCASFLDFVLIAVLTGISRSVPFGFIIALAYFVGLWAWRGTTIGGIVLKLKVVRSNGTPLTFVVALVRGLAAAFSIIVLFLGFLWIAWDKDKQGWHDKIAGTEVVRLPRSLPLVCI